MCTCLHALPNSCSKTCHSTLRDWSIISTILVTHQFEKFACNSSRGKTRGALRLCGIVRRQLLPSDVLYGPPSKRMCDSDGRYDKGHEIRILRSSVDVLTFHRLTCVVAAWHLHVYSASDSFSTMALYKSIYLLTYQSSKARLDDR